MKQNTQAVAVLFVIFLCAGSLLSAPQTKTLDIYFIDVEGGAATLIVTPTGESLLIDSGFPGEREAARALNSIIAELQTTPLPTQRIALSDAPLVERLMRETGVKVDEITTSPSAPDLFGYDIGLTAAQAAIAETGTLVLESDYERHRLVSLLPPVHIAVIDAADICPTLGDALRRVRRRGPMEMSRAITFVTGPSRTADIELTLTIGVHGPRELYVIVNEGPPLTTD